MTTFRLLCISVAAVAAMSRFPALSQAAEPPSTEQWHPFNPIQPLVDYTTLTKEEAARCTVRAEKDGKITSWVIRNAQGEVVRRFADTNNDNLVDLWCYYRDGLEVYRDIDSNFDKKVDQYRWFQTAGMRWGIDDNADGKIDLWRAISPHEVAEQVVLALKDRDPKVGAQRFNLLVISPQELSNLGLSKQRADLIEESAKRAREGFAKLTAEQKVVTSDSQFVDFGSARPAIIPDGTNGSSKDVMVCDNASALVRTGVKHEQVPLGALIRVGEAWKLTGLPAIAGDNQVESSIFIAGDTTSDAGPAAGAPSEQVQRLMADLEKLDRASEGLSGEAEIKNIDARADLLQRLADATTDEKQRAFWYQQLADILSVALQMNSHPQAAERLEALEKQLIDVKADEQLVSHVVFQRMWAGYVASQRDPKVEPVKVQEKWLADLQEFVTRYPKSGDAAEAMLQLGMYQEFVGKTEDAGKWYQQLAAGFADTAAAVKAKGALRRLNSVGSPMRIGGPSLQGGTVDLAAPQYRNRAVLIQYWATWSEKCKEDMVLLKDVYAKKGGRELEILGVCLDASPETAKAFLAQNDFPWKQLFEPGGVDGRLANEMGVMTLPLMILVDPTGKVANNNVQIAELDTELAKIAARKADTANTPRRESQPR